MKIKSYKARTEQEALMMVRNDLGPAAMIIQKRTMKQGGIFGMMGTNIVEVIAGVDDQPAARNSQPADESRESTTFRQLYDRLLEQGVMADFARELVEDALCKFPSTPFASQFPNFGQRLEIAGGWNEDMQKALADAVAKNVRVEKSTRPKHGPKIIGLVGPTGVGKTTTIAKLATITAMRHKLPTALITIDTYRIGAVDQLRTYAEMLNAPFAVVHKPEQMRKTLEHFSDKAVVFIDSIGRSPRDSDRVAALRPFFEHTPEAELHLVVSCTAKSDDALMTAKGFSSLPIKRLVFSKLDESMSFGSVYNVAAATKLPMSYLTVGQEVPDDIEVSTPARVAQLLMSGNQAAMRVSA